MESKMFQFVLMAKEAISHHDPAVTNDSNVLTFNRQKQFVRREPTDTPVFTHLLEAICKQNQMPQSIEDFTGRLNLPEWLSVAYIRQLLDTHNKGDGEGLLAGMDRYRMLENRLQTASVRRSTLHSLWSTLVNDLQLEIQPPRSLYG